MGPNVHYYYYYYTSIILAFRALPMTSLLHTVSLLLWLYTCSTCSSYQLFYPLYLLYQICIPFVDSMKSSVYLTSFGCPTSDGTFIFPVPTFLLITFLSAL